VLRYLAARELAALVPAPGVDSRPALRAALDDKDPRVRETAALALGKQGDTPVRGGADRGRQTGAMAVSCARAEVEALGHLCAPGAADLMLRAIGKDVDEVRRAALVGLVRCKDQRARTVLLKKLAQQTEAATVRELAAALIGESGDKGAAPAAGDRAARAGQRGGGRPGAGGRRGDRAARAGAAGRPRRRRRRGDAGGRQAPPLPLDGRGGAGHDVRSGGGPRHAARACGGLGAGAGGRRAERREALRLAVGLLPLAAPRRSLLVALLLGIGCAPAFQARDPQVAVVPARIVALPALTRAEELSFGGSRKPLNGWADAMAEALDPEIDRWVVGFRGHAFDDEDAMVPAVYPRFRRWTALAVEEIAAQKIGRADFKLYSVEEWGFNQDLARIREHLDADFVLVTFFRDTRRTGGHVVGNAVLGVHSYQTRGVPRCPPPREPEPIRRAARLPTRRRDHDDARAERVPNQDGTAFAR
jgi:hypothetical protein